METLLDSSEMPDLFYPPFSEKFIACAFAGNVQKFYKTLEKAENNLSEDDYQFEIENAQRALRACGEVELEDWFKAWLGNYDSWKKSFH